MLRTLRGAALVALALVAGPLLAQPAPTLSGTVVTDDGTPIPAATVAVLNSTVGTAADADGRFRLALPPGEVTIRVSAVAYAAVVQTVRVPGEVTVRLARTRQALADIVVTAQRDEQTLDRTPVAVTVIDGAEVEDARIWDTADLSGRVPSYLYQESGVGFQAIQSVRGVQVFSENPPVTTVVDGVTGVDILAGGIALADVERVEVLRGPQTTLFGRNALGGVVNVVTRPPTDAVSVSAEASGGSLGLGRVGGAVRGPVGPGRLFASASALAETGGGYFRNDTTGTAAPLASAAGAEIGAERSLYGNVSLRWLPSERWSAALNAKGQLDRSDASAFFVGVPDDVARETPDRLSVARVGSHRRDLVNGALTVRYAAPAVTVSSTSTVQRIGLRFQDVDSGGIYDSFAGGERGGRSVQTVLSQELRATTAGRDAPVQATAGLYGFTQTAQEPTTNLAFRLGDDLFSIFRNVADNAGFAAYGQATVQALPRLAVTAGLRYDVERRRATFNGFGDASLSGGTVTQLRPDTTVSGTYGAFSPKLAATVTLSRAASAYASYTRGFRAGGVNAQRLPSGVAAAVTYEPETSDNVEVGVRARLGRRVSGSLTAFTIAWDDLQFFNLVAAPFTFARENVGDAQSRGVEAEVSAVPLDGLRVDASLSLLDDGATTYRGFVLSRLDADFQPVETDVTGNRLANAPAHTAFVAAAYRRPVRPGLAVLARAEVRSVGPFYTDIQNALRQPAATTIDASVGAQVGRVEATLWVDNLTDQRALVYGSPDTSFNRRALAGPPRTVGVTVRARY